MKKNRTNTMTKTATEVCALCGKSEPQLQKPAEPVTIGGWYGDYEYQWKSGGFPRCVNVAHAACRAKAEAPKCAGCHAAPEPGQHLLCADCVAETPEPLQPHFTGDISL